MSTHCAGWLERSSTEEPLRSALAHYSAAKKLIEQLQFDLANQQLDAALELVPLLPEAIHARGVIYSCKGKSDLAYEQSGECAERYPFYVKGLCAFASNLAFAGELQGARNVMDKALTMLPNCDTALGALAYIDVCEEDYESAVKSLDQAIVLDAQSKHYCDRAEAFLAMGQLDACARDLQTASSLAATPLEKVSLAAFEGKYFGKCDDIPAALECFKRGLQLNPSDAWLLSSIAYGLKELAAQTNEVPVAAIEYFDRAIQQQPSQPMLAQMHHQKGNVLHHQLESEADRLEPGRREMAVKSGPLKDLARSVISHLENAHFYFEDRRGYRRDVQDILYGMMATNVITGDRASANYWASRTLSRFPGDEYATSVLKWSAR